METRGTSDAQALQTDVSTSTLSRELSSAKFYACAALLLILATVVDLQGCWNAPFYRVDDASHVLPATAPWSELKGERACYVVARYSFKLDYELFADKSVPAKQAFSYDKPSSWASGSRLFSGILHIASGFLLLLLLQRLGCSRYLALWVALAWTAHPMSLETLGWICERKNVLCAFFGFGALLIWSYGPNRPLSWAGTAVLFALSLYSKGTALGLGPVFALMVAYDLQRSGKGIWNVQAWTMPLIGLAGLFALEVAGAAYTYEAFRKDMIEPPGGSVFTAVLTNLEVISKYLRSIFAPFWLSFYYGIAPVSSIADPRVWLYGLPLIAFFIFCIWFVPKERRPLAAFGIAWFLLALAPHANLLSSSFLMQDRFIYLGCPGMLMTAALVVEELARRIFRSDQVRYGVLLRASVGSILLFTVLSGVRSHVFSDGERVELHAAQAEPGSAYAQLAAARIFHAHVEIPESGGLSPQSATFAKQTIKMYDRALAAPDFVNYGNPFVIRVQQSEMFLLLDELESVRSVLDGWLPPRNMALLPPGDEQIEHVTRRVMYTGYRPEALAHAWALVAESYLRQSASPGLIHSDRMPLVEMGMEAAKQSMLAHSHDFEGTMVLARLLLHASELLKEKDIDSARGAWDEAAGLLVAIPETSSRAALAAELMRRIKRP